MGVQDRDIPDIGQQRTPVVLASNLIKKYGDFSAVKGVCFAVYPGECFGLLGPNGAGKTSIVRMIYGFSPVTSGTLEVFGEEIMARPRAIKSRIGVVPQDDDLDPVLTVRENLLVYARYFHIGRDEARKRVEEILVFMDLLDKADEPVETLSGGMKRRLVLGRGLINQPELLLLDEPTTGLDPQARHLVWHRLRQLKEAGTTMLLTTHYMEEASQLCDRLIIVFQGRIVEEGSPEELIDRHLGKEALELGIGDIRQSPGGSQIADQGPDGYESPGIGQIPGQALGGDRKPGSGQPGDRCSCRQNGREILCSGCEELIRNRQRMGDDLVLFTDHGLKLMEMISEQASRQRIALRYRRLRPSNLEDVFLQLTGASLSEGAPPWNARQEEGDRAHA